MTLRFPLPEFLSKMNPKTIQGIREEKQKKILDKKNYINSGILQGKKKRNRTNPCSSDYFQLGH